MHLHHARPPFSNLLNLIVSRQQRTSLRRPRRQPSILEFRKEIVYAGDNLTQDHAWGGCVFRYMEQRRPMGRQRRRGWRGQDLRTLRHLVNHISYIKQGRLFEVMPPHRVPRSTIHSVRQTARQYQRLLPRKLRPSRVEHHNLVQLISFAEYPKFEQYMMPKSACD